MRITRSSDFNGNLFIMPCLGCMMLNALPCAERLCTLWPVGSLLVTCKVWPTRAPLIRGTNRHPC